MKIYVAAKFSEKARVRQAYALLQSAGHIITHDWTQNPQAYPFSAHQAFTVQCAREDIDAVMAADVFILLISDEPSMGASAELGAAIATALFFKKSAVYVVGPHVDQNIFFYHPIVQQKNTIEDVLQDMASLRLLDAVKSAVV